MANSYEEIVYKVVSKTLKLDQNSLTRDLRFVEDLGADVLYICEIAYEIEEKTKIKISDDELENLHSIGDVIDFIDKDSSGKVVANSTRKSPSISLSMGIHILRCVKCYQPFSVDQHLKPGSVSCANCGYQCIDLGLMPVPEWQIVMQSAVSDPHVAEPQPKPISEMPKWVCSWCGCNLGMRRLTECERCKCNLGHYAAIFLPNRVNGLSEFEMGIFYQQAVYPMNGAAALFRLGRVSSEDAQWPKAANSIFPPPFSIQSSPKKNKKPWWKFW